MFVPKEFAPSRPDWTRRLVEDNPLAILVTNGPRAPLATHLPAIAEDPGPLRAGTRLLGHLNRANPHWKALADGTPGTLIFNGPGGYVTPTTYRTTPAAPTWNYAAVHVHGTVEPFADLSDVLMVVGRTVTACETAFGDGWNPDTSREYFQRIGAGVGAFRFVVTGVDAQFKLSQDKDPEVRGRVADRFAASRHGVHRDLAALMREHDAETGPSN